MDPLRQSDSFPGRYSLTQDVTIEAEGGHQMTFDDTLRSSLGPVGDPMFVSTGRKIRKDAEESMTSSQMSIASVQSTSSLGILQLDSMGDLSTSLLHADGSFSVPRFSNGFLDGQESHTSGTNGDFEPGERGKATGVESVDSSEIDTEDELEAVRRENARRVLYPASPADRQSLHDGDGGESSSSDDSRPRLEGGSSDEGDSILPSSPHQELSLRQSAEGEVVTSPVPGDGGGGGDGMSDGETGSSLTAPSVVSGGAGGRLDTGNRRVLFRSWSSQSGYSDQERNVEGSVVPDSQQTPTPEMSRLAPHFLLPSAHPHLASLMTDPPGSPELRPFSSASSLHFEEGVLGSSQEGFHQRFWTSGMLEGTGAEEDRRGNGIEDEEEEKEAERTLIGAMGGRWSASLEEFEENEREINTERDVRQIQQMMEDFGEASPLRHSARPAYNPFDSPRNDTQGGDSHDFDFSGFDGEFVAQDDAEALLEEDQKEFEKEHKFRQDEFISSDQFSEHNASGWTLPDESHVTVTGGAEAENDECFEERVSLGEFMRTRTEALGSLSGDHGIKRPSFGTGHIKTPEGKDPVALVEMSRLSQVSEEQEGAADGAQGALSMEDLGESIRFAGVGSDTEDQHAQHRIQNGSALRRGSQLTEDSSSFAELDEYSAGKDSLPMESMYFRVADPEGSAANDQQPQPRVPRQSSSGDQMASLDLGDLHLADDDNDKDDSADDDDLRGVTRFIRTDGDDHPSPIAETPDMSRTTPKASPPKPNLKVQPFHEATPLPPRQITHLREESKPDGTKTPPIATSAIAAAIASASSCTKPEELAAVVIALSNKSRKQPNGQPPSARAEPVSRPKSVDVHSGGTAPSQVHSVQQKSPTVERKNYDIPSNRQAARYMHAKRDSTGMPREAVTSPKSSKSISELKPLSENNFGRVQPSGTDSEPPLPRRNQFPIKYIDNYNYVQGVPLSSQQNLQGRKSEENYVRRSRSRPEAQELLPRSETHRGSVQRNTEAVANKRPSNLNVSGSSSKESVSRTENTQKESLDSSAMKELIGLELSYDSRMKVHTERIRTIERAQEVVDGTRKAVRDSLDSLGSDTLVFTPRSSDGSYRDTGKVKRAPQVTQEKTDELTKKLSSDSEKDLKCNTHKGRGALKEELNSRVSPRSDTYKGMSQGSPGSVKQIGNGYGMSRSKGSKDSKSPSKREVSKFQGQLKDDHTKNSSSEARSPERNHYGSSRDTRLGKNAFQRDAQNKDFSSDDDDEDLPNRQQLRNGHKSSGHQILKGSKHDPKHLSPPQQTLAVKDVENRRNLQIPEEKPPSAQPKERKKSKVTIDDHVQNKSRLNLDPTSSPSGDHRHSASPSRTPTANKSSASPCSASSSLSESATQTSDDDTINVASARVSQPPASQPYGPPITSFQAFPNRQVSTRLSSTTPTLLTSQSLLTDALLKQYLNEQALTSKPRSTSPVAPSYVSGQLMASLDAVQSDAHTAPALVTASAAPYVAQSSNVGLTQTLPTLTINTGQNAPSLNQMQSLEPPRPPNFAATVHPLLSSTSDLGPMLDRVSAPGQIPRHRSNASYAPTYPTSATMPVLPFQSAHSVPPSMLGFSSVSASSYAALPGLQGTTIPGYPVSALPSRPGTAQEHGPPPPVRVSTQGVNPVVVGSINIKGVCCLGIAKQALLPLQNPGPRWLQCHMEVVSVSVNGEELPPDSLSSFLVKRRTIISPHNTEDVKVVFVPRQPGIYVAQVLVSSSPVTAEGEVAYFNQGVPVTILARAEKPNIGVKGAQNGTLDLGVLSYGKERSAPIYLTNKGSSAVPLRLLIKVNSSAWHSFYLHAGDSRVNPDSASGFNLPTHVTLEGQNDTATLWVHFRATQRDKATSPGSSLGAPEQVSATLEAWLDVPEGRVPVASVALRATVGLAKLNIPRALTEEITLRSKNGEHTGRMLPLKNTGNIHLDVELTVVSGQKLFTVVPQAILLAPAQEVDILIKYSPEEVPSFDTGQLTMCARPDGPSYEVRLRGEAVERSHDGSAKPSFLVNRHYISWGGVPIGRALQQSLTIRSCSKTEELKLKLYITENKRDFQLLNTFKTGKWSTENSQYVSLLPQEDLPVHILFSPTSVDTSQAKLSIKPQGSNFKYTVPLSGYGGVSKLVVENLQETEHGFYSISVSQVTKPSTLCTVMVSNRGRRSAFVKALGFQDEQGRDRLPSSQLQIDPPEFILEEKSQKTLTITLHGDRLRTGRRPGSIEGLLAGVGLFYGDEISRQQYRRALRHKHSEAVSLSEHNPLRGISFDRPIAGEAKVKEVCYLPWRSGDLNLFYRCISRVMILLSGSLHLDNPTAATEPPVSPLSPVRTSRQTVRGAENGLDTAGQTNRPVTVPYTPPVKGTPAPRPAAPARPSSIPVGPTHPFRTTGPDIALVLPAGSAPSSQGNGDRADSWSVQPQQLVLTVPGAGVDVQKSHSIRINNHSVRKLRFETMHTPDCLIVTPAAGVVEPMRQLSVLVSCNPSIQSKGVQLPWSGAILVICDGRQQEVRVQIRQDFGMDTSIVPATGKMQSLPDQPVTPDTSVVAPPMESPSPVKLLSKVIRFPGTKVGSTSEATLEFQNKTAEPRQWCLSSFAPTYVKQDSGQIYRATYSAFRFTRQSGNLQPGENVAVHLEFIPRDEGAYSQYWDLESSDKGAVAKSAHRTRIELMGKGVAGEVPPPQNPKKNRKSGEKGTLVKVEPLVHSKHGTLAQPVGGDNASEGDVSPEDIKTEDAKISRSPDSTSSQGVTLVHDHLVFHPTKVGSSSTLKVQVQNTSQQTHTVKFIKPHPPFFIRHHQHTIQPKRFIRLPVSFKPVAPGPHQAALVIQIEGHHNLLSRLAGVGT